jgi:acetyl-CoA carboxylase biotin carboxylase subunit
MGFGVRLDGYVFEGYEIPIYYDPMLAKLITWGLTRDDAIQRMNRALREYKITGVKTSISFLEKIMTTDDFVKGKYDTGFIEKNTDHLFIKPDCDVECQDIALVVAYVDYLNKIKHHKPSVSQKNGETAWKKFGRKQGVNRL